MHDIMEVYLEIYTHHASVNVKHKIYLVENGNVLA